MKVIQRTRKSKAFIFIHSMCTVTTPLSFPTYTKYALSPFPSPLTLNHWESYCSAVPLRDVCTPQRRSDYEIDWGEGAVSHITRARNMTKMYNVFIILYCLQSFLYSSLQLLVFIEKDCNNALEGLIEKNNSLLTFKFVWTDTFLWIS